jgi:capsular exopolysaccharide synthesis family protein
MSSLIATQARSPSIAEDFGPRFASMTDRSLPKEMIGVVMHRLWPAVGAAAAVMIVILALVWTATPTYVATGALQIQPRRENLATTQEPAQPGLPPDTSAIDTQVQILKSSALARAVVERLKLYDDPEFNPKAATRLANVRPSDSEMVAVADSVSRHAQIKREGLTYVVDVGFASRSPTKAAQIANIYMDTYLQRQLDEKVAAVAKANAQLAGPVQKLREEADAAMAMVQQYKIAHNLFSAEGATMAEQEVSTLNQQIAQSKADAAEKQARLDAAIGQVQRGSGGADVQAAVNSDTIRELRKQEAEKSQQLAQLEATFQPEYPEVQRTQAELNAIRAQVQAELNRILSSVRADAQAAAQREGSLLSSRGQAQGGLAANNAAQVGLLQLQERADAAKQIYQAYLNHANLVASEGSLQQPDASVASSASEPLRPSSPNKKLGAALALLLGILTAGVTILATEFWDRRLRNRADVEFRLGAPFAGVIPEFRPRGRFGLPQRAEVSEAVIEHRASGFAESLRNLGAFLTYSGQSDQEKVLAVTSALPREGKTTTSLSLARSLAMSGARVIVLDCDLRRRGLTKLVGHRDVGLVEVIKGKAKLADAVLKDEASGAWVLPVASATLSHDLFNGKNVDRLLQSLTPHYDHVLLELPPVLGLADARILAVKADRVLYLVRWNKTPSRTAQSGLDMLRDLGANVIGVALTQVNVRQQAHYGYCDSSDYLTYFDGYYALEGSR